VDAREIRNVIFWILIAEIVQQQERIEVFGFAEAKGALAASRQRPRLLASFE